MWKDALARLLANAGMQSNMQTEFYFKQIFILMHKKRVEGFLPKNVGDLLLDVSFQPHDLGAVFFCTEFVLNFPFN